MQSFYDKNDNRVIAIVEDDIAITTLLEYNLTKAGFVVVSFSSGNELLSYVKYNPIDILLLDWMLPDMSGIEVCGKIRNSRELSNIPIIIITARCEEDDKVLGLSSGADDYLVKPFSIKELSARIQANYRRANPSHDKNVLCFDDIVMDLSTVSVHRAQREIRLGMREFNILKLFMENPEKVLTREQIIKHVWRDILGINYRTVDVNINRLRNALYHDDSDAYQPLCTIRSIGYSLRKKVFSGRVAVD
ncbi:Phosphate regulon transcriptional regulatory protein PhoB [Candidatus Xenohaliotis californiensis]|uniref:Phosphate regulon transcriptional regulatory protein PhoB n=1 Tax=Candidatus Xenohaliotis californiensis TaxID=84677 RepID=A0ABM9N6X6_9RICK|nr:Phosphate regulon transcriptional regulatory protein PhoB [Candidatus Xenohaliotis californiensis]